MNYEPPFKNPVAAWRPNPASTVWENYTGLELHHVTETTILYAEIQRLRNIINGEVERQEDDRARNPN